MCLRMIAQRTALYDRLLTKYVYEADYKRAVRYRIAALKVRESLFRLQYPRIKPATLFLMLKHKQALETGLNVN